MGFGGCLRFTGYRCSWVLVADGCNITLWWWLWLRVVVLVGGLGDSWFDSLGGCLIVGLAG